jgi:hypothetical protein
LVIEKAERRQQSRQEKKMVKVKSRLERNRFKQ